MIINELDELKQLKDKKNKTCGAIKAIWLLAKEQVSLDGKERRSIISDIESILSSGIIRDYNAVKHIKDVESIVDKCRKNKYKFKVVDSVYVSKKELDKILELETLTLQRLAFAFLFNAKVEDAKRGEKFNEDGNEIPFGHNVYKKTGVLFGEAISSKKYSKLDKEIMVGKLIRAGYLELKNVHSKGNLFRKVLFLDDECNESNYELKIDFIDDYIYEFDNYIGEGCFKRCEECGKIIKNGKTKPKKFCKYCAEESHRNSKLKSYHENK